MAQSGKTATKTTLNRRKRRKRRKRRENNRQENLVGNARLFHIVARMRRISFEQKGTKETKEEIFFVSFVPFCSKSFW